MSTEQLRTTASADHTGRLSAVGLRRGARRWWYIIFLGALTFEPMLQAVGAGTGATTGSQAADWLLIIALIAIGAVLVIVGELGTDRTKIIVAVIFTLLGVATIWFISTATVFFIYAAAFAAGSSSRRTARRWFIALSVLLLVIAALSPMDMPFRLGAFAAPIVLVWLIGYSVTAEAENLRESARLRVDFPKRVLDDRVVGAPEDRHEEQEQVDHVRGGDTDPAGLPERSGGRESIDSIGTAPLLRVDAPTAGAGLDRLAAERVQEEDDQRARIIRRAEGASIKTRPSPPSGTVPPPLTRYTR